MSTVFHRHVFSRTFCRDLPPETKGIQAVEIGHARENTLQMQGLNMQVNIPVGDA